VPNTLERSDPTIDLPMPLPFPTGRGGVRPSPRPRTRAGQRPPRRSSGPHPQMEETKRVERALGQVRHPRGGTPNRDTTGRRQPPRSNGMHDSRAATAAVEGMAVGPTRKQLAAAAVAPRSPTDARGGSSADQPLGAERPQPWQGRGGVAIRYCSRRRASCGENVPPVPHRRPRLYSEHRASTVATGAPRCSHYSVTTEGASAANSLGACHLRKIVERNV